MVTHEWFSVEEAFARKLGLSIYLQWENCDRGGSWPVVKQYANKIDKRSYWRYGALGSVIIDCRDMDHGSENRDGC